MSIYDDSPEAHAHHRRKMRDVQKWTLAHTPYEVGDPFSPNTHEGAVVADPNRVSYWPPTIYEAGGTRRPAPQRVHTAPQMAGGSRVPPMPVPSMPVPPMPVPPAPMGVPPPPLLRVQTAPHSLPVYQMAGMEAYGPAVRGPVRSGYPPMTSQPPTTGYPPMAGQPPPTGYPPMNGYPPMVSHSPMVSQPPIPRSRKPSKSTRPGTPIPGGPTITVTAPTPLAKLRKKTSLAALFKSSRADLATQSTPRLVYSNAKLVRSTPHLGQASTANLGQASTANLLNASTAKLVDDPRSWYKTNASTTQLDPSRSWYKRTPADPQAIYDSRKAKVVTNKPPTSLTHNPPKSPTDTKKPVKKLVKDIFNIGGKPRERAQTLQSASSDQQAQPGLQPQIVVLPPLVSAFQSDPVPTFQQDPVPTLQHDAVTAFQQDPVPIPSHIKVFQSPENVTTVVVDAEGGSHGRRHRSRSRERRHRERSRERHRERGDGYHSHRSPTRHCEDRDDRGHKSSGRRDASRHHGSSRDGHGSSDHHGSRDGHRSHKHDRERSKHRHDREDKPREREHRSRHH